MDLTGKCAIVTGAGSGLGQAYANGLAEAGAAVVVADIDGALAQQTASTISAAGAKAEGFGVDVADDAAVSALTEFAVERFGRIDILVNNAAWRPSPAGHHYDFPNASFPTAMPTADWLRILAVNVVGPITCARACQPAMAQGGGGVIVNQSSMAAHTSRGSPYGVTKLALNAVTVGLAKEFASDGIRVNGIAPGMMTGRLPADQLAGFVDRQLVKRRGTPQDLVDVLLFLCSERSSFISGETIHVDGGMALRI